MGVRLTANAYGWSQAIEGINELRTGFGEDHAWIVGAGAEYSAYVELGTSRMKAQPYLFPAARYVMRTKFGQIQKMAMSKPNSMEFIVASLAQEIEAEAKRRAPIDTGNLRLSIRAFPAGKGHPGWNHA